MRLIRPLLTTLVLCLFFIPLAYAQSEPVGVRLPDSYMKVLGIPLGATKAATVASLGKPTTEKIRPGRDGMVHALTYGGTTFYFTQYRADPDQAVLDAIVLTNRDATIVGGVAVGDPIESVSPLFDYQPIMVRKPTPETANLFYGQYRPYTDAIRGIWFFTEKNKDGKYIIKKISVIT